MAGYLNSDGTIAREAIMEDYWFPTGDMGNFDGSGRLMLQGRIKSMINVFGIKVNPLEVATAIRSMGRIADVHVYAGKHRSGSDLVFAIVEPSDEITETEIIKYCQAKLAPQKVPTRVFNCR